MGLAKRPGKKKYKRRNFAAQHEKDRDYTNAGPVTITKADGSVEVRPALDRVEFQKLRKVRRVSAATRVKVERRDGECRYCGCKAGPWEIDHVVPVSLGGSNRLTNLVLACRECNQRKKAQVWTPFPVGGP